MKSSSRPEPSTTVMQPRLAPVSSLGAVHHPLQDSVEVQVTRDAEAGLAQEGSGAPAVPLSPGHVHPAGSIGHLHGTGTAPVLRPEPQDVGAARGNYGAISDRSQEVMKNPLKVTAISYRCGIVVYGYTPRVGRIFCVSRPASTRVACSVDTGGLRRSFHSGGRATDFKRRHYLGFGLQRPP